jgi:hypothetical protein
MLILAFIAPLPLDKRKAAHAEPIEQVLLNIPN